MSEEREWWRRVLAVPVRPRVAFAGLRDERAEAVEARQEPILALILLAGIAGILATPAWHTLMDDLERDALVVAVLTFIGGSLYGAAGYWIVGGALYLALRGLGSAASYRRARQLVALSVVPFVLSLLVLPIELAAYGGDVFRSGGGDEGAPETIFLLLRLGFVAWSLVVLVVGIQELERWAWGKVAGAVALFAVVLAAALTLPSVL